MTTGDGLDARIQQAIEGLQARLRESLPKEDAAPAAAFAEQFFAGALPEDIENESTDNLFGMAVSLWEHLRSRQPGRPRIRAFNPSVEEHGWHSPHTVIETVSDNSPFLLDSTVSALNLLDLTIHLVIHPVVDARRNGEGRALDVAALGQGGDEAGAESFIHIQVTRQTEPEALAAIEERLGKVFADVRAAVEDWQPMLERVDELVAALRDRPPPLPEEEVEEGIAFLEWLRDNNFTFLGARDYAIESEGGDTWLRIQEPGLGVLREVTEESRERHDLPVSEAHARHLRRRELFVLSKAWSRSTIHRPVYMDYIGVRLFGKDGEVTGERRFLGLLTSTAYSARPKNIPLLRRKVAHVLDGAKGKAGDHDIKALANILDQFPRDELFQVDAKTLDRFARGILQLEHRQRIRLFLRRDGQAQFYSALVFVPRDSYSSDLRQRMERILVDRLGGHAAEVATQFSEAPMVRAHYIVHVVDVADPPPDVTQIERELAAAARSWENDLRDALIEANGEAEGNRLHRRYAPVLSASYKADVPPRAAVADIARMEELAKDGDVALNLYRRVAAVGGEVDFKIYHRGAPIPLSRVLPMLEHMGLVVNEERPYTFALDGGDTAITLHDFRMERPEGGAVDIARVKERFESLFERVRAGELESDAFNALVQEGLDGREISLLRAYAKYLRQIKAPFSLPYMQETLAANPELARLLVAQFRALHDPAAGDHNKRSHSHRKQFVAALESVASPDQDRILRSFLNLVDSTLRTNFFQRGDDGEPRREIALKFDSAAVLYLPDPRPWREIFVYSPRFEGVHLRGGPVARGGIRWSDRREDFRTEILGLVKAQMVKNAVIVPVGAKGGFVLARPPADPQALREEGVACYRLFIAALLDLTDNLVDDELRPREGLVAHDRSDAYLVVAADKGTATFSDEANAVAERYGHWLGDAFASGGSAGYDHKAMGITARGGWEAVKRHFREMGRDIQSEPFTAVGVGDMAGDVFGNGMLLSEQIRLVGAFNHLHIFVDPDPDPAAGFAERSRLFKTPRSTWDDYDRAAISEGGGVFSRQTKSIDLSPQIREALDLDAERVSPTALIRHLLRAQVDLLWNGGIGTYVKAFHESHADVDDRANDALRVNGRDLRCRVVGEGGNLGVTQAGRIEYALAGGRINTDAIDNAGGVDCSDHEVNIKILLDGVIAAGEMTGLQRDRLLETMTDEVAALVLRHNYVQTQCLSMIESFGDRMFEEQVRYMRAIEARGLLARAVEGLPNEEELAEWRHAHRVFTRPELAVLLAYGKMDLYDALLNSSLPDDPYLSRELLDYFPTPLREGFAEAIARHPLRREIVATRVANGLIDRVGFTFVHRHTEHSGIAPEAVARAFVQVRDVFGLPDLWRAIEAVDGQLESETQAMLHARAMRLVDQMTPWFMRSVPDGASWEEVVDEYRAAVDAVAGRLDDILDDDSASQMAEDLQSLAARGVPEDLAARIARLQPLSLACDMALAARGAGRESADIAETFYEVGRRFACVWLRRSAETVPLDGHWDKFAAQGIAEDCRIHQRALTANVLAHAQGAAGAEAVDEWAREHAEPVRRFEAVYHELRQQPRLTLSMLHGVNRSLGMLAEEC